MHNGITGTTRTFVWKNIGHRRSIQQSTSINITSSSSCHQTCVFHLSTHLFAISLKLLRSSNEQGHAIWVHCIMCAVFSVTRSHLHVASPSKYPHFCRCSLLHVNNNNNIYLKSHIKCILAYEFSGLYTILLYNLKQYDHNQISNELVILHYCIL